MKMYEKSIKKSIVVVLINILLLIFLFLSSFFMTQSAVSIYAGPNNCYVYEKATGAFGNVPYNYSDYADDPENFSVTLTIDYAFEIGDTIIYYYLKTSSISVKYQTIKVGEEAIKIITSSNFFTAGDITFKPYTLGGMGTYNIFAIIQDVSEGTEVRADSINIILSKPIENNLKLRLTYTEIKGNANELQSYFLSAEITLNGNPVNSENYLIFWYFNNQRNFPFSNRAAFEWKPTEMGNYTIFAEISGTDVVSEYPLAIVVDYNRTEIVLLGIAGAVVVMTLFVIITTYLKVKGERVW